MVLSFLLVGIQVKAATLSITTKTQAVTLQNTLITAGYLPAGSADGVIGPKTQAALTAYQNNGGQALVGRVIPSGPIGPMPPRPSCSTTATFPTITITAPSTGLESYTEGQSIPITWTSCNVPASTQLSISILNGTTSATVGASTTNTGSFNYTIPNGFISSQGWTYGRFYKIFIKSGSINYQGTNIAIDSTSDNLFTINNSNTGTTGTSTLPPTLPIGCTSTSGFSSITGQPCSGTTGTSTNPTSTVCNNSVAPQVTLGNNGYAPSPSGAIYTTMSKLFIFTIKNPSSNCSLYINKMSLVHSETNGLSFIQQNSDLALEVHGNSGVNTIYSNSNANTVSSYNIFTSPNYIIAPNSSDFFVVYDSNLHYFDPYHISTNMASGGLAVGIGQIDYEYWTTASNPVFSGVGSFLNYPLWGNVLTVLQ